MIKKLREDLTAHMKARDLEKANVIRAILNEINIREMKNIKITDDEILKVLRSEIKKRKEAIENFQKAARQDLVDKESKEIKVIEQYLPAEISDEALLSLITKAADSTPDKSFGAIMKATIAAVNGQADGKRISLVVNKILKK